MICLLKKAVSIDGYLTHWGRVTYIYFRKQTIIGSDNRLSPGRRQAIIWTNSGILLIGLFGTNFSDSLTGIQIFSLNKLHLKTSSAKWRLFCLGLHELTHWGRDKMAAISQTTFSNGISRMKICEFRLIFHRSLLPGVELTIYQHLFR